MLFNAVRLPAPERADPDEEASCLDNVRRLIAEHGDTLAAVVVEPLVQGAAGMRMHSPEFLQELLTLARQAGALIIADEVATGFGRTGRMFAMEAMSIRPDILCLAKGLSGGYLPLSATIATEPIFDAFRGPYTEHRTFFHGHTYTGNALACAASLASLQAFDTDRVLDALPASEDALRNAMAALPKTHIAELRQHGLMAGVLLKHDHPEEARIGHRVCMQARRHGVIVRPLGDLIVLMPALAMTVPQIQKLVSSVGHAIHDVLD